VAAQMRSHVVVLVTGDADFAYPALQLQHKIFLTVLCIFFTELLAECPDFA
jgi:hypothetical protein